MRGLDITPNICPGCNQSPYPEGRACSSCGFVGAPADSVTQARRAIAKTGLLGLVFLCTLVGVMILGLFLVAVVAFG